MSKNGSGIMDVIRCDEKEYLIWKWHPRRENEGDNIREDSIRWGSPLRVKDGEVAVFFCNNKNESVQDYIEGPADLILSTENLPLIANLVGLAYGGGTPFQAEVYFINLARIIQQKFVVPYFDVYDPRFTDFGVPTAVRGTITFKITDYEQFIKLHRLITFSLEDFNKQISDAVSRYVKNIIANAPSDYEIPVVQIERRIEDINSLVESNIRTRFFEDFGVSVTSVDIASIDVDKTSQGYKELKRVTQDLTTEALKAQNEVNIKEMKANQKLGVFEKAGKIFTNFKEDTYAKHRLAKKGKYQISTESVIGKVGEMNIPGLSLNKKKNNSNVPPEIPRIEYYIADDGQAVGPYNLSELSDMASKQLIDKNTLVWKNGMEQWEKISNIDELSSVFPKIPPIPTNK